MPKYPLNPKTLNELLKNGGGPELSVRRLAQALGIDERTLQLVYAKNLASAKTALAIVEGAQNVAAGSEVTLQQLIQFDGRNTQLPEDENFYLALKHERFIGFRRDYARPDDATWYAGRIEFASVPTPACVPDDVNCFRGVATNNAGDSPFQLYAQRIGNFMFTMTGYHETTSLQYQAVFTKCFDGILSGVWVGVDQFGHSTAFRDFMAADELNEDDVRALQTIHAFDNKSTSTLFCNDPCTPGLPNDLHDDPDSAMP